MLECVSLIWFDLTERLISSIIFVYLNIII
jgi:hypothetical protein